MRGSLVAALVCAFLATTVVGSRSASADETTSSLSWVRLPGAETCMTAAQLGARVEKHLRRALVSPSGAEVSIEGRAETLRDKPRRYRFVVGGTRRDGKDLGTRELVTTGSDCRELDDELVLVVSLMIDPEAITESDEPEPPAPAPPAPPTKPRVIVRERIVVREVPAKPSKPPFRFDGYLAGQLALGLPAGTSPGALVGLRITPPNLVPVEFTFATYPASEAQVALGSVSYEILEGGLSVCPTKPLGRLFDLGGCAGVRLGNVHVQGRGFTTNNEDNRPLVDLAFGARSHFEFASPVYALAFSSLVMPIIRQRATAEGSGGQTVVLQERGPLGIEFGIGLGVHFSP